MKTIEAIKSLLEKGNGKSTVLSIRKLCEMTNQDYNTTYRELSSMNEDGIIKIKRVQKGYRRIDLVSLGKKA